MNFKGAGGWSHLETRMEDTHHQRYSVAATHTSHLPGGWSPGGAEACAPAGCLHVCVAKEIFEFR